MMEFKLDDMSCGHCAGVITKTVQALDAQARVEVDLAQKKVAIESNQERAVIAAALEEAGYPTV
jgi:copper chaperone